MAIRSGGSTGVLVGLVVAVLLAVFLLVMTIVFFAGKNEAMERANSAEAERDAFISRAEQQADRAKQERNEANNARQSLYGYLSKRQSDVASFVAGNPSADLTTIQSELGVPADQTVKGVLTDLRRQLKAKTDEANALTARVNDLQKRTDQLVADVEAAKTDGRKATDAVRGEIATYSQAATDLQQQVRQVRSDIERSKGEMEDAHRDRVANLQEEIDSLRSEQSIKESRIAALQTKVEAIELKPANPAELVDGRIIAIEGSGDQVFIDIGREQRVVPGMTFEVYDDANAIQASDRTQARGKASIQVLRVADQTSTCKIIRQSTGRPVVKDDVIANAVFNPNYRFKFLVHGKFDANGDGKPSDAEAEYVKSRISEWGGEVVEGDELTGDLDFLVLGVQPPPVPPIANNASEAEALRSIELRAAADTYDRLFRQATDARIPVLNWNRFQILTGGATGR